MEELFKAIGLMLGAALLILIIAIPLAFLNGWVISWLWLWFLTPLGWPTLSIAHYAGLGGIISYVTSQYIPSKEDDGLGRWGYVILSPFITLGIGFVIHLFM